MTSRFAAILLLTPPSYILYALVAAVFSQTLAHGNSINKIRQRKRVLKLVEKSDEYGKKQESISHNGLAIARASRQSRFATLESSG